MEAIKMMIGDERLEQIKERRLSAYYAQQTGQNEPANAFAEDYYADVSDLLDEISSLRGQQLEAASNDD